MNWLEIIGRDHKKWLDMVRKFGEYDYPEDVVQDAYIRIATRCNEEQCIVDGKSNEALMFIILRNTFCDHVNGNGDGTQKKKKPFVRLNGIDQEHDELDTFYDDITPKVDEVLKTLSHFDRLLYKLHAGIYGTQNYPTFGSGVSQRQLARDAGISLMTINRSLKKTKDKISKHINKQ